ncbi:ninjurin-1 [Rhipicephalus sanguineus]|uniref:ninjurin-1 n=1 Tax=Rhipicephalus sanguineus TaxID=34632 RepID=UPI0018953237|nr:ninjurin-1 [Rhipicephalus sanguineus]
MDMTELVSFKAVPNKVENDNVDRMVGPPSPLFSIPAIDPEVNYRNWYAAKKSVSEGLFDVALLSANGAQLKHVLQLGPGFDFYTPVLILVSLSIGFQVIQMGLLVVIGFLDLSKECHQRRAEVLTNVATAIATMVAMINVVAAAFSLRHDEDGALQQ